MECEHCFVFSKPGLEGTFTVKQIKNVLDESSTIGTIEWIYFEGGEPFLFYPLMLEGLKLAGEAGFKTGIVTNAYWATAEDDFELWLKPLVDAGVSDLSISDDPFHYDEEKESPSKRLLSTASEIGIPVNSICIETPKRETSSPDKKGLPYIGGGVLLKGRAAEKLTDDLPTLHYSEFKECPEEELRSPKRIHVDAYGFAHICQGLVMGNMWKTPLSELVKNYDPDSHPICGPLLEGGPALLADKYNIAHKDEYASACHLCYNIRKELLEQYPGYLAPKDVYGL